MTAPEILMIGGTFVAALSLALTGLWQWETRRHRQRLSAIGSDPATTGEKSDWVETAARLSEPFAKLSVPKEGWAKSPLRVRFMHAGLRSGTAVALYFAAKTLLAVVPAIVVFVYLGIAGVRLDGTQTLLILLCVSAVGYYLPNVVLSRLTFLRQRDIFEAFPDAADLLLVCVESGLGLDAALSRVAEEMRLKSEALAEELQLVNLEMRAGNTREKSLRNLAMRTGVEEVNTFATMLVQADRFGTSIGESLRVFSDELRSRRQFRAEEMAAKIPVKLLFPLIFFIFPSLLLVLLGPAFIQVYRILLPTMAGQ
jgi:tight adherence protein C